MTKTPFEKWVGEFLKRNFSGSSDVWKNDVLKRYYRFGEAFEISEKELYSRATFALWFLRGQK